MSNRESVDVKALRDEALAGQRDQERREEDARRTRLDDIGWEE